MRAPVTGSPWPWARMLKSDSRNRSLVGRIACDFGPARVRPPSRPPTIRIQRSRSGGVRGRDGRGPPARSRGGRRGVRWRAGAGRSARSGSGLGFLVPNRSTRMRRPFLYTQALKADFLNFQPTTRPEQHRPRRHRRSPPCRNGSTMPDGSIESVDVTALLNAGYAGHNQSELRRTSPSSQPSAFRPHRRLRLYPSRRYLAQQTVGSTYNTVAPPVSRVGADGHRQTTYWSPRRATTRIATSRCTALRGARTQRPTYSVPRHGGFRTLPTDSMTSRSRRR